MEVKTKIKGNLYAVYGSLKREHGNNRILQNESTTYIGTTKTPPTFSLYSLGGFPGIKNGGETEVEVEVFAITDPDIEKRLDWLEGYSGKNYPRNMYNKETVNTEFGEAFIYVYNGHINENRLIPKGIW